MVTKGPVTYVLAGILAIGLFVFGCGPAAQAPQQTAGKPAEQGTDKPRYEGVPFPTMGTPKYGGVLRTAQTDDPPNFDLYSNSTTNMQKFTWAAYNNVVLFDPYDQAKIMPDAAERWEISKDGKEVTFYLHKNIKFHNGTPLTAKDVKFSLEFMKDPPKGNVSVRRDNLEPIVSIETPDDYTVKLTRSRPYAAPLATRWQPSGCTRTVLRASCVRCIACPGGFLTVFVRGQAV